MTILVLALTVLSCLLVLALLFVVSWLVTLRAVNTTLVERGLDHDDCNNRLVFHTGGQFAALVLLMAADKWDSVENMKVIERLRREWKPGREGVAAQWLREEAEQWRTQ